MADTPPPGFTPQQRATLEAVNNVKTFDIKRIALASTVLVMGTLGGAMMARYYAHAGMSAMAMKAFLEGFFFFGGLIGGPLGWYVGKFASLKPHPGEAEAVEAALEHGGVHPHLPEEDREMPPVEEQRAPEFREEPDHVEL